MDRAISDSSQIEQMLDDSLQKLADIEEKKRRKMQGLPTTETEKATQLIMEEVITEPLDEQAEKRLRDKIDLIKLVAEASQQAKSQKQSIDVYGAKIDVLSSTIQTVASELQILNKQMQQELARNAETRQKENEALAKLNKYLDEWL